MWHGVLHARSSHAPVPSVRFFNCHDGDMDGFILRVDSIDCCERTRNMHPVDVSVLAGLEFFFIPSRTRIRVLLQDVQAVSDYSLAL